MKCLKCGRETDQTFCQSCREHMARYPAKPGTIIQLPKDRSEDYAHRNNIWRVKISPEIRIAHQKRTIRRLSGALAAMIVLLIGMGYAIIRLLRNPVQPPVGQNYSTVTKPTETTEADTIQDATEPTTGAEDET